MSKRSKQHQPPEFATGSNPRAVRAVQERRRSGAAGIHGDRRTKRVRTRCAANRAAIRASHTA